MQQTLTKLPLAQWARIMGVNSLHFWGVTIDELTQSGTNCETVIFQHDWQSSDRVGREQIAQAIAEAEAQIEQIVGYHLAPTWDEDEWRQTIRPTRPELFNLNGRDLRGFQSPFMTRWAYVLSGGIRSVEVLNAVAPVTYENSGRRPTTYKDRATVEYTSAVEFPDCELHVYHPGHAGDDRYRIRPVTVSHDANLLYTVTFPREMAVKEEEVESYDLTSFRVINGTEDAPFETQVALCRVYNDPQQQAQLMWQPPALGCGICSGSGCASCAYGTQAGCLVAHDPRLGIVAAHPGAWNADDLAFDHAQMSVGRNPDAVRVWYYSGWRDRRLGCSTEEMDGQWARVVAYLAASKLDRPTCACTEDIVKRWGVDHAVAAGSDQVARYNITLDELSNPLGTTAGGLYAWRFIQRNEIIERSWINQ